MAARIITLALVLAVAQAPAANATVSRTPALTKRHARGQALRFIAPFVDLLDVKRHVSTRMDPPRRCMKLSATTVVCRFSATLYDGRVVRDHVRVHRQLDGLLGFATSLDVLREGVPVTNAPGSGS